MPDPATTPDTDPNPPQVNLWGPVGPHQVEGFAVRPPRRERRPWGLLDVVWALLALLAAQVVTLPVLIVLALVRYDVPLDHPDVADHLIDAVGKVALTGPGLVLALLSQWAVFVGMPALASYRKGHRSLVKDFGFRFRKTDLAYGALVAAALQALLLSVNWLAHQTSWNLDGADNTNMVTDHGGLMLVIMALSAIIAAPLTEELFFRGLLLRAMLRRFARRDDAPVLPGRTEHLHTAEPTLSPVRRRLGVAAAILLSSAIFGLMHFQPATSASGESIVTAGTWLVVTQTGLLGLVFAIIANRTKRLGLTICTHFYFNTASLTLVMLTAA